LTENRPPEKPQAEVPPTKLALVFGGFVGALMLALAANAVLSTRGFSGPVPLEVVEFQGEQACHRSEEGDTTEHPA
jgi:hypothetical protein